MKTKFFPNFVQKKDLPTWEDIILDLDYNIQNDNVMKKLPNLGFVTHTGNRIESVRNITDKLIKLTSNNKLEAHVYISLLSNSDNFGRHNDYIDVYYILALGQMKWIIEGEEKEGFILNPGDMIFIPKNVYHTPITYTPRVGISIG